VRNALSVVICFLLFETGALVGQTSSSGWETPAGLRPGSPGLTTPILKSAQIPPDLANRQPGRFLPTVDVLVTIEKDGRVNPVEVQRPDRQRAPLEKRVWDILKTWTFEPGMLKGKPVKVGVILSVPYGEGRALGPANLPTPRGLGEGIHAPLEAALVPPIRLMGSNAPYLTSMISARTAGDVEIAFVIQADGHIGKTVVLRSLTPDADETALATLRESFYLPALVDGMAVASWATVTMSYSLR
jgi:TonB family protein